MAGKGMSSTCTCWACRTDSAIQIGSSSSWSSVSFDCVLLAFYKKTTHQNTVPKNFSSFRIHLRVYSHKITNFSIFFVAFSNKTSMVTWNTRSHLLSSLHCSGSSFSYNFKTLANVSRSFFRLSFKTFSFSNGGLFTSYSGRTIYKMH